MKIQERRWIALGPYAAKRALVQRRGVADVRLEVVRRVVLGLLGHERVTRDLRDARRRGDCQHADVTLHDGADEVGPTDVVELPVEDDPVRHEPLRGQLRERPVRRRPEGKRHPEHVALLVGRVADRRRPRPARARPSRPAGAPPE